MVVNSNIASLQTIEKSYQIEKKLSSSLEKLSTGLSINKASDDASGMAISDKLRTQQSSLSQGIKNINSAVAMIQMADKAMGEQSNILDIVKTKLIQGSTATTSDEGRTSLGKDIHKLLTQLDNIAKQTNYNGITLLQESSDSNRETSLISFTVDGNDSSMIEVNGIIRSNTSGLTSGSDTLDELKEDTSDINISYFTRQDANDYMEVVDLALKNLNIMRSDFASTQVQLESSLRNNMTTVNNIAAAESIIRDVDFAKESSNFTKSSLMFDANSYAISQANAKTDDVLLLLV